MQNYYISEDDMVLNKYSYINNRYCPYKYDVSKKIPKQP